MMRIPAILAVATATLMAACSMTNDSIDSLAADALDTGDTAGWVNLLGRADSLATMRDTYTPADMASFQGTIVAIVNNLTESDSLDAAARGMRLWVDNYSYMMERDSAGMTEAMLDMQERNPRLNAAAIDSVYRRALDQLKALERAVNRVER